jgi:hypothetical protein
VARRSKRPDGRYERNVTLANGKRISVYAETAALADQEAEKMRKKIAQGINPLSERVPLGEYLQLLDGHDHHATPQAEDRPKLHSDDRPHPGAPQGDAASGFEA